MTDTKKPEFIVKVLTLDGKKKEIENTPAMVFLISKICHLDGEGVELFLYAKNLKKPMFLLIEDDVNKEFLTTLLKNAKIISQKYINERNTKTEFLKITNESQEFLKKKKIKGNCYFYAF